MVDLRIRPGRVLEGLGRSRRLCWGCFGDLYEGAGKVSERLLEEGFGL